MKDRKLSFSSYSMVSRLDEECLCLCPPIKLLINSLLNSSKELTVFRGILLNHTCASLLRVVGKALHIISSGTPWRCIIDLKVAIWSHGSCVLSYESKEGILNLGGKGWLLMEAVKSSFDELSRPPDLPFSCSPSSRPWTSSSDPSPSLSVAPSVKRYPLIGSQAQHFLLYFPNFGLTPLYIFHDVVFLGQSP